MNWYSFWQSHRGSVICVRDGAWVHKAILYGVEIVGGEMVVWIADNNPVRRFPGYRTLQDFANGGDVWIERSVQSWQESEAIIQRVHDQIASGCCYDLLTYNCEHFVSAALGLEPESKQLQGYGLLAACVVGLVVLANVRSARR
jgi:Lecithin retinol acyltransferase